MTDQAYQGWAIVELMGHRKTAGMVSEAELAGAKLLRVDTPGENGAFVATQYYGGAAIYCVTPSTEETVRALLARRPYSLPEPVLLALPKPGDRGPVHDADEDLDGDGVDEDEIGF